jgi:hypothetical protein
MAMKEKGTFTTGMQDNIVLTESIYLLPPSSNCCHQDNDFSSAVNYCPNNMTLKKERIRYYSPFSLKVKTHKIMVCHISYLIYIVCKNKKLQIMSYEHAVSK